jgi:hypothetical protein
LLPDSISDSAGDKHIGDSGVVGRSWEQLRESMRGIRSCDGDTDQAVVPLFGDAG